MTGMGREKDENGNGTGGDRNRTGRQLARYGDGYSEK